MVSIGFTSSREVDFNNADIIIDVLKKLPKGSRYVTGACVGGDQFISSCLFKLDPSGHQVIACPSNKSRVNVVWLTDVSINEPNLNVIYMPDNSSYKERNKVIVALSDMLIGFPLYPEDHRLSRRSGTWQTIRLARAQGISTDVYVLSEYLP